MKRWGGLKLLIHGIDRVVTDVYRSVEEREEVLKALQSQEVLSALLQGSDPSVESLMMMRTKSLETLRKIFAHDGKVSPLVTPQILAQLRKSMDPKFEIFSHARKEAIGAYRRLRSPDKITDAELQAFSRTATTPTDLLGLDNDYERAEAVRALSTYAPRLGVLGVEPVIKAAADESREVRHAAAWALGRYAKTLHERYAKLEGDAGAHVRAAIEERKKITEAQPKITEALAKLTLGETENDIYVRRVAAIVLGDFDRGDPGALHALIRASTEKYEPDEGVRYYAATSLTAIKNANPTLMTHLRSALDPANETKPDIREQIAIVLRCFDSPESCTILETALKNPKETDARVKGAIERSLEVLKSGGKTNYLEGRVRFGP